MKRVADRQLIKDDDDDDEVEEVGTGFRKADESVLAARPIRGLPKRSSGTNAAASLSPPPPVAATEAPPAPGKFSGFSGFGSSATNTSSFSFGAPSAASKSATSAPSASFSFSGAPSSQPPSLFGTPVSSDASPATKAFASIVSSSSAPALSSAPTSTSAPAEADEKDIEYFKALRGLNVSLLSAISKAIEADPFVDVAELLERYKSLRVSVGSDRAETPKTSSVAPSNTTTHFGSAPKPTESSAKPLTATSSFTMPAPPTGFSGFKPIGSSSTPSSSSSGSGFVPKVDNGGSSTLGSPFSFAAPKAAASEPVSEAPKSSFSFGSSSATSTTSSAAPAPFTFGASTSGSSLFSKPSASSSSTPSFFGSSVPSAASVFGSNLFSGKSSDASKDKDADKTEDKDSSNAITSSGSGSSSTFFGTSSTGGSNPFVTSTPEKASPGGSSGFSFGSASPSKGTFFSGFPKAGSIGNPVGFGFGSPPKTPDAESADGPVKSLPFAFGAPKAAEPIRSDEKDASSGDGTPAPESTPVLPAGTSIHDQEGEGEEHEVTTHEVRSKVYKMTKDKDGNSQWGDLGVGVLRLKKHKETESRRMLLRNSSTGKITINFILYSGMNASVADKVVSFIGHDEGHSTPYRIRCKTAAQANELKAALNREIEFVKAKSEGS